jgi:hypothetical protein
MNIRQRYDIDPFLEAVSKVIPDAAIDAIFPKNFGKCKGRHGKFKTSQLFRIHLAAMLKQISSFNKLCAELKIRRSLRDFCNFKSRWDVPIPRVLSEFRMKLGDSGLIRINELLLLTLFKVLRLPRLLVAVPDSTDLEAACKGFRKKNAGASFLVIVPRNILPRALRKEPVRKNPVSLSILWDIKSIRFGSSLRDSIVGI